MSYKENRSDFLEYAKKRIAKGCPICESKRIDFHKSDYFCKCWDCVTHFYENDLINLYHNDYLKEFKK